MAFIADIWLKFKTVIYKIAIVRYKRQVCHDIAFIFYTKTYKKLKGNWYKTFSKNNL